MSRGSFHKTLQSSLGIVLRRFPPDAIRAGRCLPIMKEIYDTYFHEEPLDYSASVTPHLCNLTQKPRLPPKGIDFDIWLMMVKHFLVMSITTGHATAHLKAKIENATGFPCDQMSHIFSRVKLEEGCTMKDHGIDDGDIVYLTFPTFER
ncbi:hypothetical protein BJ878DRAFT_542169 [Calycina marina]|uniref:Ubiquitin-like domain-containing protein n=1 Tax=Calycina marina TaxID=1763456 RepID=A0A9P7Z450_9HELO|nr:hypothetical protein BJ878DRAFT_542169 [Calycina marina]